MYLISLFQGMIFYAPVATLYRQAQGVTVLQITLIESISLVLCMVMELPWGILADKIGYKKTMILCNGLYFISKIVFWRASGFGGFLAERIMLSVVCAGLSGVDASILYLSCEEGESQKVFSIYNGLGTVGLLITSVVYSAFIGDNYSLAGFLTVISYGMAMLISFPLKEVKRNGEEKDSITEFVHFFKQTLKNKQLFLFLLGIALFNEAHQTITVFLSQLQYVRAGISNSMMGVIYGIITVVALSSFFSDKMTKKMGDGRMMRSCFMAAMVSCILLAFTNQAIPTVIGVILLRLGFSLAQPLQTELQNRQVMTDNRATALSVNSVFMDSMGIGTNVVFGALAEYSLPIALGFGAVVCAAGWLLFELWNWRSRGAYLIFC